jgi:hypothetical protein
MTSPTLLLREPLVSGLLLAAAIAPSTGARLTQNRQCEKDRSPIRVPRTHRFGVEIPQPRRAFS